MKIDSFEDLNIWQEARILAKSIRQLSRKNEFSKDFRFTSQINSTAASVMDNIAEGFERDGGREFIQFLSIAKASNAEVRSQVYRAFDADFITEEELNNILEATNSIKFKIVKLTNYLKTSKIRGPKYKPNPKP